MEIDGLVRALAVWGAITGTIGTLAGVVNLIIRYKQHKGDQPKLRCQSEIRFHHLSGRVTPNHRIVVRSIGRRPVSIDLIRYYFSPDGVWPLFVRRIQWALGKWRYDQIEPKEIHLLEGKKTEIPICLPKGSLAFTRRVLLFDQTGKPWKVKWPTIRKIRREIYFKKLHESEESNEYCICKVMGYAAGGKFYIFSQWKSKSQLKSSFKGRYFNCKKIDAFERKLEEIITVQRPKLLIGEVEEIL